VRFVGTGSDHLTAINAAHVHVHSSYGNGGVSAVLIDQLFTVSEMHA
jgi:hypothetical protein